MAFEGRSRLFRRWCPPRKGAFGKIKLPELPLILAGALGGPFCIFVLTPLRNALTLASQDAVSSPMELYASTFQGGFASGWTGGFAPVLPSCPQFCMMGPLFHFLRETWGSVALAVLASSCMETFISYGSQTLNAQMAFNSEVQQSGTGAEVPLWNPLIPLGPGVAVHVVRNVVALSGIRIFSGPCQKVLKRLTQSFNVELPLGLQRFLSDFVASIGAAIISAPLNQCYNFAVTSAAYMEGGAPARVRALAGFLSRNYLLHGPAGEVLGLSPTLARDLFMRCAYVATLFTLFGAIERAAVAVWKYRDAQQQPVLSRRGTVGVRASS
uniref:ADP,ATP carrier protein n=1 Tax=Zooxanthella nutricula TaxID=1333877 RepID=A0A6U8XQE9_9DINO